jgi:hypothetical protein
MRYRLTLIAVVGLLLLLTENARAVNLLNNGVLEPDPLAGWDVVNTVTGMPGASVNAGDLVGFANHPNAVEGESGFWLKGFAGYLGEYGPMTPPPNNVATNAYLIQTVPGIVGQTYTLKGWSKYESNFSGAVDSLDLLSPSGEIPSPTATTFNVEFLNSGGGVIGSPVTLNVKADRDVQGIPGDNQWREHTLVTPAAPGGTTQLRVTASATDMLFNIDPMQSGFYDDFSLRASGAPATELLVNGNLNTGSVVSGWTFTHFPAAFTGDFNTAGFANHTPGGTTGLWMKPFGVVEPVGKVLIHQTVEAGPGDYTLSGYSKWETNFELEPPTMVLLQLEYLNASDVVIGSDVLDVVDEGQMSDNMWRQYTLDGTAPAGTAKIRVSAGADGMDDREEGEPTGNQSAFWDDLVLELAAAPGLVGDHNGDGVVDAADYVAWRKNPDAFGGPGGYTDWVENFGEGGGGSGNSGAAVPEPAAGFLVLVAAACCATIRRQKSYVTN